MLLFRAEAHDLFDTGTIIPGTVEKNDLPRRRKVCDVTLEIPLPPLALGWYIKGYNSRRAGIQVLHETLDCAALTRGVTAFEYHYDAAAGILDPVLQLKQFHLEHTLRVVVFFTAHPVGVGILLTPGVHLAPVRVAEHRVVLVGIVHPHARRYHIRAARLPSLGHIRPHPSPWPCYSPKLQIL